MRIIQQIAPFFLAVFILAVVLFGMVLLSYLILFVVVVSSLAYLFNRIKLHFAPKQPPAQKPSGRVYDIDEWRKL